MRRNVGTVPVPVTHWGEPVTIDPVGLDRLGPANEEQVSDRKKARRAARRAGLRRGLLTIGIDAVFGFGLVVGSVIGALNPDMVLGVLR